MGAICCHPIRRVEEESEDSSESNWSSSSSSGEVDDAQPAPAPAPPQRRTEVELASELAVPPARASSAPPGAAAPPALPAATAAAAPPPPPLGIPAPAGAGLPEGGATEVAPPQTLVKPKPQQAAQQDISPASPNSERAASTSPSSAAPPRVGNGSALDGVLQQWSLAVVPADLGATEAAALKQGSLLSGLEAFGDVLDALSKGMGDYVWKNTKKMRNSKAPPNEDFRLWMLGELPQHAATKYAQYVDDSAWMGNVWAAWTLEFFVELFANVHRGMETKKAAEAAYGETLKKRHNFVQSTMFNTAMKRLPQRELLYERLKGSADPEGVVKDVQAFVRLGRAVHTYCAKVNLEVETAMKEERSKKFGKGR